MRCVLLALRGLVLLVSIQLSGLPLALEASFCLEESSDCCTDCPLEQDGKDCPPGCPNCHCGHGGVALPPTFEEPPTRTAKAVEDARPAPREASVPLAPPLPGLYRPPRRISSSV